GYYRTPEEHRDADYVAERFKRCARNYQLLDQHLASQHYLAGDGFTMAEIPTGTTLFRYFEMDIERPAYQEHVMLPFGDLFGRVAF
ncbi:MAG: glutathione binding-like protein, partial [Alphaproteobacteria bacterium]|nr:glutathione binding-like protein [Alphaproteobacteria bacterium]